MSEQLLVADCLGELDPFDSWDLQERIALSYQLWTVTTAVS